MLVQRARIAKLLAISRRRRRNVVGCVCVCVRVSSQIRAYARSQAQTNVSRIVNTLREQVKLPGKDLLVKYLKLLDGQFFFTATDIFQFFIHYSQYFLWFLNGAHFPSPSTFSIWTRRFGPHNQNIIAVPLENTFTLVTNKMECVHVDAVCIVVASCRLVRSRPNPIRLSN